MVDNSDATYDPSWVEGYFDEFAGQEWDRLVRTPHRELQLEVHRRIIETYVRAGHHLLEVGAGSGRFTQILHHCGSSTVVADISQVQLDLNRMHAVKYGFQSSVKDWAKLDFCDMSCYEDDTFDGIVCIGGPLSYVLDHRDQALAECIRVTKPGGYLIFSVMSLWGTVHQYLEGVLAYSPEDNERILETGDLIKANSQFANHFCHMFRADEFREFLEGQGLYVEVMSAAGVLSSVHADCLQAVRANQEKWTQLVEMEIQASRSPGALDMGTHLIAVAKKTC